MNRNGNKRYSLQRAQQAISENIKQLPGEVVDIKDGMLRVTSSDVAAVLPQPSFDESTRDGYVIPLFSGSDHGINHYKIVDEIPAGKVRVNTLKPGTACRIMTGGCVPKGGTRVVPFENCVEENGEVIISDHLLQSTRSFIRKAGSEIKKGERLVAGGVVLEPMHLAQLSSCGVHFVVVTKKPSVGYFCTGSELKGSSNGLEKGEKVSSNSFLLQGLLTSFCCCPENLGIIEDNRQDLHALFVKAKEQGLDAIISTGGMGPGKYDLVKEAFVKAGGQVIFTSLKMRPGKSVLFGTLGNTLFFGLPGPPHAVQTLFNMLVGPTLLAMQGVRASWPQKVQASLHHSVRAKRHDVLRLKDGMLVQERGRCKVRFTKKLELANCYILLLSGREYYPEGELVDVYLTTSLCLV